MNFHSDTNPSASAGVPPVPAGTEAQEPNISEEIPARASLDGPINPSQLFAGTLPSRLDDYSGTEEIGPDRMAPMHSEMREI